MAGASPRFLGKEEFIVESRLTPVSKRLQEPMEKQLLRVLMALVKDVPSTMRWDADLPSGEPCSRLEMACHQRRPFERMLMDLQNMEPFASKMALFQLLSQKSCKMVIMISKSVLKYLSEFLEPS